MAAPGNVYLVRWRTGLIVCAALMAVLLRPAMNYWERLIGEPNRIAGCAVGLAVSSCWGTCAYLGKKHGQTLKLNTVFPYIGWTIIVVWGLAYVLAVDLNCYLDSSPVTKREVFVADKRELQGLLRGEARSIYQLEVASWRAGRRTEVLVVDQGVYRGVKPGSLYPCDTRKGALGLEYRVLE